MDHDRIPLSEMIQHLRNELEQAQVNATNAKFKFKVESVELELSVAVTKTATANGGIKFWVIEAGAGLERAKEQVHKFTVTLKPSSPGDIEVSSTPSKKRSDN